MDIRELAKIIPASRKLTHYPGMLSADAERKLRYAWIGDGAGDASKGWRPEGAVGLREGWRVGDVEEFGAEFDVGAFREWEVFHQREI